MDCIHCQTEIPEGSQFCPGCGERTSKSLQATATSIATAQTLWAGHPTLRSFEGTFFLSIILLVAAPIVYGFAYLSPVAEWFSTIQDIVWSTASSLLGLTNTVPEHLLANLISITCIILACALLIRSWIWSRRIHYRLTQEHLTIASGFLTRTHKQLPLTSITDLKLEQSFFDRLVDVGTIDVDTSDSAFDAVSIHGIASPTDVFDIFSRVWRNAATLKNNASELA